MPDIYLQKTKTAIMFALSSSFERQTSIIRTVPSKDFCAFGVSVQLLLLPSPVFFFIK